MSILREMLSAFGIDPTSQNGKLPRPSCFQIPLSKVRKAASLHEANEMLKAFDGEFKKRALEIHHPAIDTYRLVSQLTRMSAIGFTGPRSEGLRVEFGFSSCKPSIFRVFVGDCGGSHFRKSYDDGDGIFIDLNELVKSCIFVFSCFYPNVGTSYLPSFVVAFSQNFPRTPLPFQDMLFWRLMLHCEDDLLNILNNIIHFIVLHEFGHVYSDQNSAAHEGFQIECLSQSMRERYIADPSSLRTILPVGSVWTSNNSPDNPIVVALDWILYHDRTKKFYLPQGAESFRTELYCDYFSLFHLIFLSDASSESKSKELSSTFLIIFGLCLFLQEINYFSKDGMRDLDVRNLLSTLDYSKEDQMLDTHPRSFIRWQSMALTANALLGESHWESSAEIDKYMRLGTGLFGQTNLIFCLLGSQTSYDIATTIEFSDLQARSIQECGMRIEKYDARWSRLPNLFKLFLWHAYGASMFSRDPSELASMDQLEGDGAIQAISFIRGSLVSVLNLELNPIEKYFAENPNAYRRLLELYNLGEPIKIVL